MVVQTCTFAFMALGNNWPMDLDYYGRLGGRSFARCSRRDDLCIT